MSIAIFVAIGVFLICGALFRWRWLVDPPAEMSPYYSQALLKTLLGTNAVVWFTYLLGALFIAVGILLIFQTYYPGSFGQRVAKSTHLQTVGSTLRVFGELQILRR